MTPPPTSERYQVCVKLKLKPDLCKVFQVTINVGAEYIVHHMLKKRSPLLHPDSGGSGICNNLLKVHMIDTGEEH